MDKPISVLRTVAGHYFRDGCDFGERFDLLWESQLHKTGRIKSFVDLLMGCECALKCHVLIGGAEDPQDIYSRIRGASHDIGRLSSYAGYLDSRAHYEFLKSRLERFSIAFRYSLDAYESFFPSGMERNEAAFDYGKTIGNNGWVLEIRECLKELLDSISDEFCEFVTDDLDAIFAHEQQMKEFAEACLR